MKIKVTHTLGNGFLKHNKDVTQMAFVRGTSEIASISYDGSVIVWTVEPTHAKTVLYEEGDLLPTLAVDSSRREVVYCDGRSVIKSSEFRESVHAKWSTRRYGVEAIQVGFNAAIGLFGVTQEGLVIALNGKAPEVKISVPGSNSYCSRMAYRADSAIIALSYNAGETIVLDLQSGRIIAGLHFPNKQVAALCLIENFPLLAIGFNDGNIIIWDYMQRRTVQSHTAPNSVHSIVYVARLKKLYFCGIGSSISSWKLSSDPIISEIPDYLLPARCLAVSPEGSMLVTGHYCGAVCFWRIGESGELSLTHCPARTAQVASFRSDGLLAYPEEQCIRVFDAVKCNEVALLPFELLPEERLLMSFSRDGRWLATTNFNSSVFLVDASNWKVVRHLECAEHAFILPAFNFDSTMLAIDDQDGAIHIFDTFSLSRQFQIPGCESGISSFAFSPKNNLLAAVTYDEELTMWHVDKPSLYTLAVVRDYGILILCWSIYGDYLICGSKGGELYYMTHDGEVRKAKTKASSFISGFTSVDDKHFLIATADGKVSMWNAVEDEIVASLRIGAVDASPYGVDSCPSKRLAVTANGDGTFYVLHFEY